MLDIIVTLANGDERLVLVNATRDEWKLTVGDLLNERWFTLNSIYGETITFQSCHVSLVSVSERGYSP